MTVTVVFAAFSTACCHLAAGQAVINLAGSDTPSAQAALNRPLGRFESHDEPALHALLRVGLEAKLPLGIVADERLCTAKVNVNGSGATPAEVIGMILDSTGGNYDLSAEPIEVIIPRSLPPKVAALLHTIVRDFRVPESTLAFHAFWLWGTAFRPQGFGGSVLATLDERYPAVEMRDASVEAILNTMVAQGPMGAWVVFPNAVGINGKLERALAVLTYWKTDTRAVDTITCPQFPQAQSTNN